MKNDRQKSTWKVQISSQDSYQIMGKVMRVSWFLTIKHLWINLHVLMKKKYFLLIVVMDVYHKLSDAYIYDSYPLYHQ